MTVTLTIDDPVQAQRVVDGLCVATRYDAGSGKTKAQWIKERMITYMKTLAARGESQATAETITGEVTSIVIY